jgi:hyperosmotically inducible protein
VKSRLAADAVTKDANISVTTTQGVVVLSGTLASQDAVDHVKQVAQNVQDVKSVDTSALKVTGTS